MKGLKIDSFSGKAADLRGRDRTPEMVLGCLRKSPRVSVWDMDSEWLRDALDTLERQGKIAEVKEEPYPWLRFRVL